MLSYGGWATLAQLDRRTRAPAPISAFTRSAPAATARARVLTHGTTLHGIQNLEPGLRDGADLLLCPPLRRRPRARQCRRAVRRPSADRRGRPRQRHARPATRGPNQAWTFFEIDPAMVQVARTPLHLPRRCAPQVRIVLGDARLSLARQPANSIDILAVDAFSSDAVPMHLLTREALARLWPRGAARTASSCSTSPTAISISSRSIADLAAREGWTAAMMQYVPEPRTRRC